MNSINAYGKEGNNKKLCLISGGIFGLGMILTIILGIICDVRFEVMNAIFLIIAIAYTVVLSKIEGDEDILKNRTIMTCSAAAKLTFLFSMIYECELWWSASAGKDMAFYFYLSYIAFFIFQSIETFLFYINKTKVFRIYVMVVALISYFALVVGVNSYWVLIVPITLLTAYSQCNDIKLMTIGSVGAAIITMCGSFTQVQYYDTGLYAFITDIPSLLKNAVTNSLREDSEYMFCVYLLIISAFILYAFAMIRVTKEVKIINDEKISIIEHEQNKTYKMIDSIKNTANRIKNSSSDTNSVIKELDNTLKESEIKLGNIEKDTKQNVISIEQQTEMTSNIAELIKNMALEVDKAAESTYLTLSELESSKKSYADLKKSSKNISDINKQVIKVIEKFSENVRKVGNITKDIDYISEETDLLSFNTYVKSARAGSVGKGFEVVASKIRELSESTFVLTESINEIVGALENSAKGVQEVIGTVEDAINDENNTIDETMVAFENMDRDIKVLSNIVHGISERMDKVSSFNNEIVNHINQLMQSSEGVTSDTEQVADMYRTIREQILLTSELTKDMLDVVNEI